MKINTAIQELARKARKSVVDYRTQNILLSEAKRRVRRDQPKLFEEVSDLINRAHNKDIHCIQPILKRCYLRGQYRDHESIRYFLKAHITTWPYESFRVVLSKQKNSLEFDANNPHRIPTITFPLRPERTLPCVSGMIEVEQVQDEQIPQPLPIDGQLYTEKDQRLNDMLTKVLKLYKFLRASDFIHSRKLGTPIAILPLTILGDDISESRKKNVIKKKISLIRHLFTTVPPLEYRDSRYLTKLLDYYQTPQGKPKEGKQVTREYKKFLRKTYTIDKDFNILMNKYSFAQANDATNHIYFQKSGDHEPL